MIKHFACKETERLFKGRYSRKLPQAVQRAAARKLDSLRIPPGNRLEALSGNRQGQYSIRINQQ